MIDVNSEFKGIKIDFSKDAKLTEFSKAVLKDRYLYKNSEGELENNQQLFARVSSYYSDDAAHAQRLYDYMSNLWFMPATPILSNGGTDRGLPISCFLNETSDSLQGIIDMWTENALLASKGGGIGSYWGNLRSIGESVKGNGKTSGIIPFIVVQNALTLAISQGSLRRGSSAVYLPVEHPEIEEFLDIRRPIGGDPNRKALNLHHGVIINDKFMNAVEQDSEWELLSPKDNTVIKTVKARSIWIKILSTRMETGEPYVIFIDTITKNRPEIYKKLNLNVKMSNLCTEITLATGKDYKGNNRTAVCCLSSLNLSTYDEWKNNTKIVEDVMRFLDNVLSDFIKRAPSGMKNAVYSAIRERSVGLGIMGFHSYLQQQMIPFESPMAKDINLKIFKFLKKEADKASHTIALERGSCEDAKEAGFIERFVHKISIAPTASISIIAGSVSPGIDPNVANIFTHRTLTGSFVVRNQMLVDLLESKGKNTTEIWNEITNNEGSVKTLDCLTEYEKEVFKTAYELDQNWVIEHAADRTPYICQAQSLNLFVSPVINKKDLNKLYFYAWKRGIKSLYYKRSKSLQRGDKIGQKLGGLENDMQKTNATTINPEIELNDCNTNVKINNDVLIDNIAGGYDEGCLSCQ